MPALNYNRIKDIIARHTDFTGTSEQFHVKCEAIDKMAAEISNLVEDERIDRMLADRPQYTMVAPRFDAGPGEGTPGIGKTAYIENPIEPERVAPSLKQRYENWHKGRYPTK